MISEPLAAPFPGSDDRQSVPLQLIRSVRDSIASFPATRYYGSKKRLLSWMFSHLGPLSFHTALDAFGGTASVSLLFRAMRKAVTYHDGFLFNEDVARTVLSETTAMTRTEVEHWLYSVEPSEGVVTRNFSGIFFTDEENGWLDGFAKQRAEAALEDSSRRLLNHLVFQACLKKRPFNLFHRANLRLRTNADVKRSFGNASTWEKSFVHHALKAYDELTAAPRITWGSANVLSAGDAANVPVGYDLVYLDPPYISQDDGHNRDDYWRRYHFLEGFTRYDDWETLIDWQSDVRLFPAPSWFGDWARIASHKERLFSIVDAHRESIVVLSYVSGTSPTETEILAHFEARFADVSLHTTLHNHALSKERKRELLFIGLPR